MAELGAQVLLQLSRSSTSFFFFDYDHGTKLESPGGIHPFLAFYWRCHDGSERNKP